MTLKPQSRTVLEFTNKFSIDISYTTVINVNIKQLGNNLSEVNLGKYNRTYF